MQLQWLAVLDESAADTSTIPTRIFKTTGNVTRSDSPETVVCTGRQSSTQRPTSPSLSLPSPNASYLSYIQRKSYKNAPQYRLRKIFSKSAAESKDLRRRTLDQNSFKNPT